MKILVIGSGAREHALVHTFFRQGHTVYCHPGNPGMAAMATVLGEQGAGCEELCSLAKEKHIDLTAVGPEAPLEKGIRDIFTSQNQRLFGPSRRAAQLETSKAWAKQFMLKYGIPTPSFSISSDSFSAQKAVHALFSRGKKTVVKASGLARGKGVFCCQDPHQAFHAIQKLSEEKIFGDAGREMVIEEEVAGPEISLQTLTNGTWMAPLLIAKDHKRLLDGDLGPITGGIGAYAPVDIPHGLLEEIKQTILRPTLRGLQQENILYQGVLYFGLMLTTEGPKVLEYNCRFGDPEAQAILPLLDADLAELMLASLEPGSFPPDIRWKKAASCAVVLATKGYPEKMHTAPISLPEMPKEGDLFYFHAATALDKRGKLITTGGRVATVAAIGGDLHHASCKAYSAIEQMACTWAHFRKDIGHAAIPAL